MTVEFCSMLPPIAPAARRLGPRVNLLVWHDIVPAKKLVWFDTTVAEFEAQLRRLERAGARPISIDTLETWLSTGANPPPPRSVVLCFDDNTTGIAEHAFPRLSKRGWPFVLSAHTAYVGVRTGKDHNDWDALRRIERGGGRVVSQTHTHPPDLRTLKPDALLREMTTARSLLDRALGRPTRFVTYPSGKWDTRVAEAARRAGYVLGLTEDFGAAETSPHRLGIHRYSTHKRFDQAIKAIQSSS